MSKRLNISSGTKWEDFVGYSRAVRMGNMIEVAGTVATDNAGNIVGKEDPYVQARFILEKIETALQQAGASMNDVVKTVTYVTDIDNWEAIGKAHGEFFREIKPVSTLVEVSSLIGADFLVEIEARAILTDE